tara:strand:- start:1056 stop:1280 length:225 start_codon:yes stop_codon:yes gene_type:complete
MDLEIVVDGVEVKIRDADLSTRQILHMLRVVTAMSAGLQPSEDEPEKPPVGFSAQVELDPERNTTDVDPDWFDE